MTFYRLITLLAVCIISGTALAEESAAKSFDAADFDSLHAAMAAVSEHGGVLEIPPGYYEIEQPLMVTGEDILIRGSGTATHIHNTNQEGQPALALLPEEPFDRNATGKNRKFRWRVQIENLRITGNENSGAGIHALWVNEIFLHGITVSEHGTDGVLLDYCYEDPRVNDCLITYNKQAGLNLLGCHDIVVSGTHFEENNDAVRCIDGFNLCMTGNNLDDHLRHGVVIENTYGSVLSGNMIEECRDAAVVLDRDCYGNTISANVIAHNGRGVVLKDAHGCAVSANTFTINKADAVYIGPESGRIAVTGNNFSNSFLGGDTVKRAEADRSAGGLVLEKTANVTVSGNIFAGLTAKAIEHRGGASERILVQGNIFTEVQSDHEEKSPDANLN